MDVLLVMFKADGTRRDFPITKPRVIIGRINSCDLRIPLSSVSRQHCELRLDGQQVKLRDLGSSNGTYVNHTRITEAALAAGDEIAIGPVVFTVVVNGKPVVVPPVHSLVPGTPAAAQPGPTGSLKFPTSAKPDGKADAAIALDDAGSGSGDFDSPVASGAVEEESLSLDEDQASLPIPEKGSDDSDQTVVSLDLEEDRPGRPQSPLSAGKPGGGLGLDDEVLPLLEDEDLAGQAPVPASVPSSAGDILNDESADLPVLEDDDLEAAFLGLQEDPSDANDSDETRLDAFAGKRDRSESQDDDPIAALEALAGAIDEPEDVDATANEQPEKDRPSTSDQARRKRRRS